MKKMLAILLTFSLLMTAVAALAEDNGSVQNQMPAANGSEPFHGGGRPEDVPEPPNGEKPEDAPEPPTGEKPDAAPEKPTGEKPADPPQKPEDGKPADQQGKPDGEEPVNPNLEMVNQLLEAGILTQDEADSVSAWITENMPMNPAAEANG